MQDLSVNLSITEVIEEKYKSRKTILNDDDATLTHYIHSNDLETKNHFKEQAINYLKIIESTSNQKLNSKTKAVPFLANKNSSFKFIDLFAGIGGFRLALQQLTGQCVYSSEFEPNAKFTYATNFGEVPFGDITLDKTKSFIPKSFDMLCGGFPCQAFSIAGLQKGFADTRGTLFFDMQQIIEKHRPKVVFLENVKNLLTHDKGKTFKIIKEILENKLGYVVYSKILNSMTHANIPQNRERIFIVAFDPLQVDKHADFKFPDPIKLTTTIHHIIKPEKQADKYYYNKEHMYYEALDKAMQSKDTIYQWRRVYVRENKSNVCPTLTANMGSGGHNVPLIRDNYGIRKLTPRECFSFQGYPAEFVLSNLIADGRLYAQAGNSVTTPLIKRIAENIIKVL